MACSESDILKIAREVLDREANAIRAIAPLLDQRLCNAVKTILDCEGKVILTAVGKSGHIGRKIAATLASTGTPAFFVHPTEALHGDLGMIRARDVVIAISHSGATAELLALIPVIQKIGAPVIAICQSQDTPLGRASQICIETGVEREADGLNLAPTASTTVTLALGDALAVAVLQMRGFKTDDFAFLHPGGKLGQALRRVRDIVPQGNNPVVPTTATVQEAIVTSKEFNLGAISVVDSDGKLEGILTDGDIGRILQHHRGEDLLTVMSAPVTSVMTAKPMGVDADSSGEQVVTLMESKRTYVMPVLDAKRVVVGMVQMHDLIRAGYRFQTNGE